jgi:hypothetical protein
MSCPIWKRQETVCLECLTGQLWPSTRYSTTECAAARFGPSPGRTRPAIVIPYGLRHSRPRK